MSNTPTQSTLEFFYLTDQGETGLNSIRDTIHDWAKKKGWWTDDDGNPIQRNKGELLMLMVTELAECMEFLRMKGGSYCPHCPSKLTEHRGLDMEAMKHIYRCGMCGKDHEGLPPDQIPTMDDKVPELTGEEAELADCMIRILDYCGGFGIDIGRAIRLKHEFNITRPYRHGKKC